MAGIYDLLDPEARNMAQAQALLSGASSMMQPSQVPLNFMGRLANASSTGSNVLNQSMIQQLNEALAVKRNQDLEEERRQRAELFRQSVADRQQQATEKQRISQAFQGMANIPQTETVSVPDEYGTIPQTAPRPTKDILDDMMRYAAVHPEVAGHVGQMGTLYKTLNPEDYTKPTTDYSKWLMDNKLTNSPENRKAYLVATKEEAQAKHIDTPAKSADQELVRNMLREGMRKAGIQGEPTETQVAEGLLSLESQKKILSPEGEAQQTRIAGARAQAVQDVKNEGGFMSWTPQAKEETFMFNALTGKPPVNAQGMGANDRKAYGKEYAQWQIDKGFKGQDIALMQADYKAGDMSLRNMTKQEAPMSAFVGNINKQISKVEELYNNNDRIGLRLLDLPVREIKLRAVGSGDEAVKASYLLEISNEIGKLSSGASGSVQQLSDSAKEDWKRVHDPNLSLKEIMKVVGATRDQANMRIQSWREAKQSVRGELKNIGVQEPPQQTPNPNPAPAGRDTSPALTFMKAAKDRTEAIRRIKVLAQKGWSREELATVSKEAGWE